jgi:DNA-binding NarL/FixJ family response regulator
MARRRREAPAGLRGAWLRFGGEQLVVFSHPLAERDDEHALTPAERDVVSRVVQGCSNQQIAVERGTSPRTVAKQVQSIYRKLSLHSRAELAVWSRGGRSVGK